MVNVKLPLITSSIKPTPSMEECFICQSQYRDWLKTKNRGSINRRINIHKLEAHGVPLPPAQPQQLSKKPKIQPPGEGRWIKPVDSPHVQAQWYPASSSSSSSTTTWVPSHVPRKFSDESDEDVGLIDGFDIA